MAGEAYILNGDGILNAKCLNSWFVMIIALLTVAAGLASMLNQRYILEGELHNTALFAFGFLFFNLCRFIF